MTSEAKQEVARLLLAGEKTSAIQYLSDTYTISLQDAKLLVETLEAEMSTSSIVSANPIIKSSTALDGKLKGEIILLLKTKGKIEAIKYVKKTLNIPLKEALMMVGEVARETNPNYAADNARGCLRGVSKGLGIFFGFVALLFVGSAGVIFYSQTQSIGNSDLVTGQVAEMRHIEEGGSAPVIQFEWKGMKRTYLSNTYSSPLRIPLVKPFLYMLTGKNRRIF
ncbi:MAG: hypothetical protein ABIR06_23610 [Cyclobacteriaceae bacterium]